MSVLYIFLLKLTALRSCKTLHLFALDGEVWQSDCKVGQ
jgi:hypothetical protein